MRIVGGALGGRRFGGPPTSGTRPMSERVREALASLLASREAISGRRVLDLFAGTGALSFEMLSRGASEAVLVERDRRTRRAIEQSAQALGVADRARVLTLDLWSEPRALAARLLTAAHGGFSLVFVAPPYREVLRVPPLVSALACAGVFTDDAVIVLEHPTRTPLWVPEGLVEMARYRYGDTSLLLARVSP